MTIQITQDEINRLIAALERSNELKEIEVMIDAYRRFGISQDDKAQVKEKIKNLINS